MDASNLRRWVVRQAVLTSGRKPLNFAHESLAKTPRQESLRTSLLARVMGATHGRPRTVRKHAEGTLSVDQGAAEAVLSTSRSRLNSCYWSNFGVTTRKAPVFLRRLL